LLDSALWPFVQAIQRLEFETFGCHLHDYKSEIKGSTLLDRKRFHFAAQKPPLEAEVRRKLCRIFLTKGLEKKIPTQLEFTAYGQACLEMARGIFQLLAQHNAVLFASAIAPQKPSKKIPYEDYLRKDQVFLFERYYYFLEEKQQHGLLVVDEVEKISDRKFVRQLEAYFTKTSTGRYRSQWIVPSPFFVASDMIYPVQAADVAIYCINWGFRLPKQGMNAVVRQEIADEFASWLHKLEFRGTGYRDGEVFESFGIFFVPNPYGSGRK